MDSRATKISPELSPVRGYSKIIGPLLTLVIGGVVSVVVFYQVYSWEKIDMQSIFEFNSQLRLASLQTDIARHQEVVNSIAGLFSSSKNVTRKEFHDFVNATLSRYPNIQGLSWNPLIAKAEQKKYTKKALDDGIKGFQITELDSDGDLIKAPVKDNYVAVYYIEPFLSNEKALGFNIASNPARLKAIDKARDTGLEVITERIRLVQEEQEYYGYLLLKAIYQKGSVVDTVAQRRKNFAGLAVGVFRFRDWIPLTMRGIKPLGIDVWITDETATADKRFLHFHSSQTREQVFRPTQHHYEKAKSGLHWQTTIEVMGRQWSFLFAPSPAFLDRHKSWRPLVSLILGLVVTLLLSLYLLSRARHAQKLAITNGELVNALDEIKTLQGIIPICSYCHSIRDDEGAWDRLESYLSKHSDASFSHGICPGCLEKAHSMSAFDDK